MSTIVLGLNSGLRSIEEKAAKKKVLIDYLQLHFKQHNMYALRYWLCELLCLVNVIGQLYLMNRFTGGEFFSYGLKGNRRKPSPVESFPDGISAKTHLSR